MQTSKTSRSETRRANAARKARLDIINAGVQAEIEAFRAVIQAGTEVRAPVQRSSMMSGKRIVRAWLNSSCELWVECADYGGWFTIGNDGTWDALLKIAGVPRDPRALGQF